jgi:hypothetical protein
MLDLTRLLTIGFVSVVACAAQESWMTDRELAADLRQNGVRIEMDSAIVYFEKDALPEEQMKQFAMLADHGVADIETLLDTSPEARKRIGKVEYFVSSSVDISHSYWRSVYLSVDRVSRQAAPYLHETTHIIARCRACAMWLSEGLASYVQSYVSEHMGGYDGAIFSRGGNRGIDRAAARWLRNDRGQAVLPYVGGAGEPPNLDDRRGVGAPFYILSQSFVKFLAENARAGHWGEIANSEDPDAMLEQSTQKSMADLKTEWLASIDVVASHAAGQNSTSRIWWLP